jgi:hypothetical protein
VLQRVDLQEPPESLHFGVEQTAPSSPAPWQKQLRYASGNGTTPVGSQIPGRAQQVTLRPGAANVVQIDALARAMAPQVWAPPPPSSPPFTAAQFGLEMIEGAGWVSFQVGS